MQTIRKLWWISRPISWINTAFPFAAGYLLTGGKIDALWIVATLYFLIPYNLFMYGINDVYDYESDIKNPRKGGIEGMREARAFHPTIVRAVWLTNVPFVAYLVWQSNPLAIVTLVLVLFLVLAYSLKGLRFKEIPFVDSLTSGMHFVGPLLFALALNGFTPQAWWYVLAFLLWGMASHAFGAVQDIVPDRKGNLASIATVLGARRTVWLVIMWYAFAGVLMILQGGWMILIGALALAYIANVAPYHAITDKRSARTNVAWRRFIWLNYGAGAVVTICIILQML